MSPLISKQVLQKELAVKAQISLYFKAFGVILPRRTRQFHGYAAKPATRAWHYCFPRVFHHVKNVGQELLLLEKPQILGIYLEKDPQVLDFLALKNYRSHRLSALQALLSD